MATRKSPLWVPERAEVIFIQYSPHVGKEMPSDHPMLVGTALRLDGDISGWLAGV